MLIKLYSWLKTTLDAIPDLMFVIDKQGYFVDYHNRFDLHNTAIAADRIVGSHVSELFSPEETATQLALYRRCIDTGQVLTHTYELVPDGMRRTFSVQLARLDTDHVLAIVRDITQFKQMEERLKQCEELLKTYQ